jgi:phosphatidylglycerophosphate synthase
MFGQLKTLPNQLALLRILLVPVLWAPALMGSSQYVGAGLVVAGLTDFLDGLLARTLHQVTELGARLDTIADNLLVASAVAWIFLLRPEVFQENAGPSLLALALYLLFLLLGWVRFRRLANLHLYSAKVAATAGYVFLIHAFLFEYSRPLYYVTAGMFVLTNVEGLLLLLTRSAVDEHTGSILIPPRREGYG